ncbi:SDR family NAD(P)-dependent oxidoreductase [Arthrobacter ramosus]|uniref:SDR family NAD(P)-dependent oxidoreductase n=1 Tax=Arthrobacter ramosus TaxID=1672 RepID=A0ABV5Y4K7_ARTRM|nr:glucose 1-dehydrogenase [Arthrobacter ramosus]
MGTLDGKVAIITGAASGQGAAEAAVFVSKGARVVIGDIQPQGEEVAKKLGENAIFVHLDVSKEADWSAAVEAAHDSFGPVSVLVNNAAYFRPKPLLETTQQDMELHFAVNVVGPFLGILAVVPDMRELGGGSIINTISTSGIRYLPEQVAYAVSKWAGRGFASLAAAELAKENIRVNSIYPGLINTPMIAGNTPEMNEFLKSQIPLGRLGEPEDIAGVVAFLASDEARYMVGAEVAIDAGARLRL